MKILLVRKLSGYTPCFESDYENARRHKIGDVVEFETTEIRNPKFHKKVFGLINLAFNNQSITQHRAAFREWLIIESGHFEIVKFPDGTVQRVALSLSYKNMDQEKIEEVFQDMLQVVITFIGSTKEEILNEVLKFA